MAVFGVGPVGSYTFIGGGRLGEETGGSEWRVDRGCFPRGEKSVVPFFTEEDGEGRPFFMACKRNRGPLQLAAFLLEQLL